MSRLPDIDRRKFLATVLKGSAYCAACGVITPVFASKPLSDGELMENWMTEVTNRAPIGSLNVSKFVERVWFLTKTIGWKPDQPEQHNYGPVDVPKGFVTDFASIPRAFWAILPPDGKYIYPAVVHDYMYWSQDRPRAEADAILKIGMEEFKVPKVQQFAIYNAVKHFGSSAWEQNANLKAHGEKRILARFPEDPRTLWKVWKSDPENVM